MQVVSEECQADIHRNIKRPRGSGQETTVCDSLLPKALYLNLHCKYKIFILLSFAPSEHLAI